MSLKRRISLLALVGMLAGFLLPAGPARAAETYDVQFGADFFEMGVPGFSLRSYPTSVNLMQGDTIHFFGFGAPALLPAGEVPAEWTEGNNTFLDDKWFQIQADPDDGPEATKFNLLYFETVACDGTEVSPCVYDGSGNDPFLPPETETGDLYVTIDVAPGNVIWGYVGPGNSPLRIRVVDDPADASSQAELDARAASQLAQDLDDASALHEKFSAKRTWHRDAQGRKVWDAWGGVSRGPLEFLAMYPKRLKIRKGQRVQWHFGGLENEVHTVVFSVRQAEDVSNSTFFPSCDPDGDAGPGPDNPANFEAESEFELCPDISQLEFELDPREIFGGGNGVFNGKNSDLEASGIKGRESYQDGLFNDDPFTLKFKNASNDKGYRYFCTIHGKFMGGRVIVRD